MSFDAITANLTSGVAAVNTKVAALDSKSADFQKNLLEAQQQQTNMAAMFNFLSKYLELMLQNAQKASR